MSQRIGTSLGVAWLGIWLATACGGESIACGPGTVSKNGACVLADDTTSCGTGTTLVDGACVADEPDVTAAEVDTSEQQTDASSLTDVASEVGDDVACAPQCVGRVCGDNGCGGSCGTCADPSLPLCEPNTGQCVSACVPDCLGRDCGSDGCGGSCGTCSAGLSCSAVGRCVPPTWSCPPADYNGGIDPCHCGCGAPDPDCANSANLLAGCDATQKCNAAGQCESKAPSSWTCAPTAYAGLDNCDCGCGAPDPDCAWGLPLVGCKKGEACDQTGKCLACTPNCAGKLCGDDGCGGSCGACVNAPEICLAGACVHPCNPTPVACASAACGDDGCGGSCGSCPASETCKGGSCVPADAPPKADSCVGRCGTTAPAGCYCVAGCESDNSCCSDFAAVCSCQPKCDGKSCGDDGCGGTCGTCDASTPYCSDLGQCVASCTPQCDGNQCGDDGCGGSCGTCASGQQCSYNDQCVPAGWFCPLGYYGDGVACDCGCGAVDPDCSNTKLGVFGCPSKTSACNANGTCAVTYCSGGCTSPTWCTGIWWSGSGAFQGVCATPDPLAKAAGAPCSADGECASNACVTGLCATHCSADSQCLGGQRCLASWVSSPTTAAPLGVIAVCQTIQGSGASCAKQSDCPGGELCQAYGDGATWQPRYLCTTGTATVGASCFAGLACADGKFCAPWGDSGVCTFGCPGGQPDCPAGTTCKTSSLFGTVLPGPSGETKVARCMPN